MTQSRDAGDRDGQFRPEPWNHALQFKSTSSGPDPRRKTGLLVRVSNVGSCMAVQKWKVVVRTGTERAAKRLPGRPNAREQESSFVILQSFANHARCPYLVTFRGLTGPATDLLLPRRRGQFAEVLVQVILLA